MAENQVPKSERWTRKQLIDKRLTDAGWQIIPENKFDPSKPLRTYNRCAIEEYPTDKGPSDYALCADGKILGVVEAKKLTLGPQNVLSQAERYSKGLTDKPFSFRGYGVPFLYSTNGEVIWHHDIRHELNRSRQVAHFHTPDALLELLGRDLEAVCDKLSETPNDHALIRPYQKEANAATEDAIAKRKRQMLLAMATGTGKTFTLVNEIYRLIKAGVVQRVLFLVDRRALAAQAIKAFTSFDAEPGYKFNQVYEVYHQRFQREDFDENEKYDPKVLPKGYLKNPKPNHPFVYVSTIQRMTINLFGRDVIPELGGEEIDEDADQDVPPIHAFDLIIADECHRGYTGKETAIWRQTLDHFDAIKIGLTATPAAHTTSYFKEVVYRYEYERAVREGFLVDYDVVAINSNVRMKGVFLKEGEQVSVVDPETGNKKLDEMEDERQFETTEIEAKVTSPDSNRKILEEIKKFALDHEAQCGRFPKTLIFAANDLPHTSHADSLVDIARDVFGRGDTFVQKITGSPTVDRPLQRIREFRNRTETGIVVTVDMLSTGVDIPDLEYIVFLRPVKSRILFEQMLGRGTRKGEQYPDKSHFVVFDCFDGTLLEYFKNATAITAEPPQKETRTIPEIVEAIWDNRDREYNTRCLVKRLRRVEKEMAGEAREDFAAFIGDGDMGRYASELPRCLKDAFTATMKTLRDAAFQELLENYKRKQRTFLIAHEAQDTVSSEWRVRGLDGKEYKPADYLAAFATFVQQNPEHVDAIAILLARPKDWNTNALSELRQKLAAAPPRFTEKNLQAAHKLRYDKALADIISMVKHAADTASPLLTAEERAERAFEKVTASKTFTEEQQKWLERIRAHIRETLSIDEEDFTTFPIFERAGGWGRANKVFVGVLPKLIREFNEAIAV
ncbi:MAG TPA: type I restriction-modification enzyme R subunit C-terminal domain-containing protein [Terriglobia bacterium]|nr:type I restriction-modification enzyme R subunit C-terminal domain-containing protein [Terriglobia bacterium]